MNSNFKYLCYIYTVKYINIMSNNELLIYLTENNKVKEIEFFLKNKNVDPSSYNNFVIKEASRNGYLKAVELFLKDSRVDPLVDDNYTIRIALYNGHLKVVELLLKDERVLKKITLQYAKKFNLVEILLRQLNLKSEVELENYLKLI